MPLRDDQLRMVHETDAAFRAGHRGVLNVAPTGSGKGELIAHWLGRFMRAKRPAAMGVHLREIALDTRERLLAQNPGGTVRLLLGDEDVGDPSADVTIGTVQTMAARTEIDFSGQELFIVDEAHRATNTTTLGIAERMPRARRMGLTATGQRGNGSGLGPAGYTALVQGPQIEELVELGCLSEVLVIAPDVYCDALAEDPALAILRHHRAGDTWIAYGSSIAHSHAIDDSCRANGLRSVHVDSDTPKAERAAALARLEAGELDVVCNFRLFVEGVNIRRVSGVVLACAFSHAGPYLQAIGRGRRVWPGKRHCTVLDLRGNMHRHEHPNNDRTYHLEGKAIRTSKLSPVVNCRSCLGWYAPRPTCPLCGARLPAPPLPKVSKKELKEQRQAAVPRVGKDWELWCELVQEQRRRGLKPSYPYMAFTRLTGHAPKWPARFVPAAGEEVSRVA